MDIDLLLTPEGDTGLVSDASFGSPVAGAMFDVQTRMFTLEFADLDSLDLNIPVDDDYLPALLYAAGVQIGVIENGQVEDSWQVPLMLINDPDARPGRERPIRRSNSVLAFEKFVRSAVAGQPLHRDNLGDEASSGSVMAGMNRAVLQFAPQLARQRALEAQPNFVPQNAPGLGLGGGSGRGRSATPQTRPRRGEDEE